MNVQVEPNGTDISGLNVSLEFTPEEIQVDEDGISLNSILGTPTQAIVDNDSGIITLSWTELSGLPTDPFELGSVTFRVQPVSGDTTVSFAEGTSVVSGDNDVTGNTVSTTFSIGSFIPPLIP